MSEIILGPVLKYEDIRGHAFWTRAGIDTTLRVDEDSIETYKAHLRDCRENPTVGLLARKKYILNKPMNYPQAAWRNVCYIKKQPEVDTLQKSMEDTIQTLYPRTRHIREYIIDNNRVVLDGVEKVKKYSIFNKLTMILNKYKI